MILDPRRAYRQGEDRIQASEKIRRIEEKRDQLGRRRGSLMRKEHARWTRVLTRGSSRLDNAGWMKQRTRRLQPVGLGGSTFTLLAGRSWIEDSTPRRLQPVCHDESKFKFPTGQHRIEETATRRFAARWPRWIEVRCRAGMEQPTTINNIREAGRMKHQDYSRCGNVTCQLDGRINALYSSDFDYVLVCFACP